MLIVILCLIFELNCYLLSKSKETCQDWLSINGAVVFSSYSQISELIQRMSLHVPPDHLGIVTVQMRTTFLSQSYLLNHILAN